MCTLIEINKSIKPHNCK